MTIINNNQLKLKQVETLNDDDDDELFFSLSCFLVSYRIFGQSNTKGPVFNDYVDEDEEQQQQQSIS